MVTNEGRGVQQILRRVDSRSGRLRVQGLEPQRSAEDPRGLAARPQPAPPHLTHPQSVGKEAPLYPRGAVPLARRLKAPDLEYVQGGGRGGVTRSAASSGNTTMAVDWVNALQTLCESTGNWGIPATISVDPANISGTIDQTSLAATMDTEQAFELGVMHGKMYRAVGITMLLGPMISIGTQPTMSPLDAGVLRRPGAEPRFGECLYLRPAVHLGG